MTKYDEIYENTAITLQNIERERAKIKAVGAIASFLRNEELHGFDGFTILFETANPQHSSRVELKGKPAHAIGIEIKSILIKWMHDNLKGASTCK
jgi:hypothetical protein